MKNEASKRMFWSASPNNNMRVKEKLTARDFNMKNKEVFQNDSKAQNDSIQPYISNQASECRKNLRKLNTHETSYHNINELFKVSQKNAKNYHLVKTNNFNNLNQIIKEDPFENSHLKQNLDLIKTSNFQEDKKKYNFEQEIKNPVSKIEKDPKTCENKEDVKNPVLEIKEDKNKSILEIKEVPLKYEEEKKIANTEKSSYTKIKFFNNGPDREFPVESKNRNNSGNVRLNDHKNFRSTNNRLAPSNKSIIDKISKKADISHQVKPQRIINPSGQVGNTYEELLELDKSLYNIGNGFTIEEISQLEPFKVQEDLDENCPICLDSIKRAEFCVILDCLDKFHDFCLFNWLQRKKRCPKCRYELKISIKIRPPNNK